MKAFNLKILADNRKFFEGEAISLVVPTPDGEYGILADHYNMVVSVMPGTLKFKTADQVENVAAVSFGLLKVEHGEVLALVETIERPEEIDEARAKRTFEEAQEELLQKKGIIEHHLAQLKLARAINRLKVKHDYNRYN